MASWVAALVSAELLSGRQQQGRWRREGSGEGGGIRSAEKSVEKDLGRVNGSGQRQHGRRRRGWQSC